MMKKSDLAKAQHPTSHKDKKNKTRSEKPKQQNSKIRLNQIRGFVRKYSSDNSPSGKTAHLNKPDDSGKHLYPKGYALKFSM